MRSARMSFCWFFLLCVLAASVLGSTAYAGGPRHGGLFHRQPAFNRQAAIAAYGKAVYPRYNFGFHTRELQNIGVPHGDIGILGSGLSRDPW